MFETIVWATDGSELADGALERVKELAKTHGSKIVAVHAVELLSGRYGAIPQFADDADIQEKIGRQVEELRESGFAAELEVRSANKDVATLIAHAADDVGADLIVVGTHGHTGIAAALLGSVARALCHKAGQPVLVVPPPRDATQKSDADTTAAVV